MSDFYIPGGADFRQALMTGQQQGQVDLTRRANVQAGGLMSSGDYSGAAKALYGIGDIQTGAAVQDAGVKRDEHTHAEARRQAVQAKLAAGDIAGAYGEAGTDSTLLEGLDKVSAHAKETTETMAGALQALKGPDGHWLPDDVAQAKYEAMKPALLARGIPADKVNSYVATAANNAAMEGQVLGLAKTLEMHKGVSIGGSLIDPITGKAIYQGTEWKSVGADDKLVPITGGQPGLPGAAPASGATAAQAAPAPTGGAYDQVASIAQQNGAKPEEVSYLRRLAQVESSGNPAAQNGSSTGVFQFHPDTFANLGGHDIHSVPEQTYAALSLSRRDRQNLQSLGIEPTDANAYIMHQQGAAGGRALLTSDPNANAVQVLTPVYGSAAVAKKAIVNNGGSPDMTAGQFRDMWTQRWGGGGAGHPAGAADNHAGDPAGTIYGNSKGGDDVEMTPAAINLQASKYLQSGVVPPFGMGTAGTANRNRFYNAAAQAADDLHLSAADLVSGAYTTKALGASLTQMQKSLEATQSYEKTAIANGQLMLSLAPKGGGPTNVPVLNRWIQYGRKEYAGDPDVVKFDNAIGAFAEEYAKVMTGNLGNVAATDGARKDAAARLSKYATANQLSEGFSVMKQEMENRNTAQEDQVSGIQAKLRAGVGGGDATPPPATGNGATHAADYSPAQRRALQQFTMRTNDPVGAKANPYVPTSAATFEKLPVGSWFINPADGQILKKSH